jgi:hypothetical protein
MTTKQTHLGTEERQSPQFTEAGPSPQKGDYVATQAGDEATTGTEAEADHGLNPVPDPQREAEGDHAPPHPTPTAEDTDDKEPETVPRAEDETEAPMTGMSYVNSPGEFRH